MPLEEPKRIRAYSAVYGGHWFPFPAPVPVRALSTVYANGDRQNAIRQLLPTRTHDLIAFHGDVEANLYLRLQGAGTPIPGGRVDAVVKRRIGQRAFRERLLDRYGAVCAVTGEHPEEVLDAAHLYTFAERPEHEENAGLLLRADVHRLFDRLILTVDTVTWRSQVAPAARERFPSLDGLHEQPLHVPAGRRPERSYLEEHFEAASRRWRRMAAAR